MVNIKRISTIAGKTATHVCTSTLSSVVSNPAASGKLVRIYCIRATNIGTEQARLYSSIRRSGEDTFMMRRIFIDANTMETVNNKYEYIYLEEGDAIYASVDVAGPVHLTVVYDVVTP